MMIQSVKKQIAVLTALLLLALAVFAGCGQESGPAAASGGKDPDSVREESAQALINANPAPGPYSTGGDWLIKGISLAETSVPDGYYDVYYDNVRATVKSSKGVLSDTHYTEYMRVIIGLTAIGKDVRDVEGYDLTLPLDGFDGVTQQGPNASCYALIAAHLSGITLQNEDSYLQDIQTAMDDALMKEDLSYPDYLGAALEAFSFYRGDETIDAFIEQGVSALSELQQADGDYGSVESTAEVIIALAQLGIDPRTDERFVKNGKSAADGLMKYYAGKGAFRHLADDEDVNAIAAEKALLALDALHLLEKGARLYP